jgi:hypothetical protein
MAKKSATTKKEPANAEWTDPVAEVSTDPVAEPQSMTSGQTPHHSTMGLSIDANSDIWSYQGSKGMVLIGHLNTFIPTTLHLGAGIAVTSGVTVLAAGWWFVVASTTSVQLVNSTGTTTSPLTGQAYQLLV